MLLIFYLTMKWKYVCYNNVLNHFFTIKKKRKIIISNIIQMVEVCVMASFQHKNYYWDFASSCLLFILQMICMRILLQVKFCLVYFSILLFTTLHRIIIIEFLFSALFPWDFPLWCCFLFFVQFKWIPLIKTNWSKRMMCLWVCCLFL